MGGICWVHLMVGVLCLGVWMEVLCQEDAAADAAVYIVTLRQAPAVHYYGGDEMKWGSNELGHGNQGRLNTLNKPRYLLVLSSSSLSEGITSSIHPLLFLRALLLVYNHSGEVGK